MANGQRCVRPLAGRAAARIIQYRNRAEELCIIGDDVVLDSSRETLKGIAKNYDDMPNLVSAMSAES
jgi:hypothetical protein